MNDWEEEQAHLDAESAGAIADMEAKEAMEQDEDLSLTELARLIWYIRTGSIYPKDEWDRAEPASKKEYYAQAEMFLAKARPIIEPVAYDKGFKAGLNMGEKQEREGIVKWLEKNGTVTKVFEEDSVTALFTGNPEVFILKGKLWQAYKKKKLGETKEADNG